MKILFVCKHNKFRSKIAEAYFNNINKNKKNKAKSAGIIRGSIINYPIVQAAKEFGIKIRRRRRPKPLTTKLLRWQDMMIIVADDVPRRLFGKKDNLIVWGIPDTTLKDEEGIRRIIKMIIKKVDQLIKNLERSK